VGQGKLSLGIKKVVQHQGATIWVKACMLWQTAKAVKESCKEKQFDVCND